MSGASKYIESMRLSMLELIDDDHLLQQARELRDTWLQAYPDEQPAPAGKLFIELPGIGSLTDDRVLILWRLLVDWEDVQDDMLITTWVQKVVVEGKVPSDRVDCIVAYLQGDGITFRPHSQRLLIPFEPTTKVV